MSNLRLKKNSIVNPEMQKAWVNKTGFNIRRKLDKIRYDT